jgi:3-oxoacyl-[acyl-carrier protein] reductase
MSNKLSGKIALVTGGSRGIGAAIALELAEDGADVAISYASSADKANEIVKQIEALGRRAIAFKADQADTNQVKGLVKDTFNHFGQLDILVNNAGVWASAQVNDSETNEAALAHQQAVNINGVVTAVREASKVMNDGGRIISIGSVLGTRTPWAGLSDYSATKAAVAAYTRGWARDLGPKGITVNNVQPGPTDTDMNPADGDFANVVKPNIPLGRYAKPKEIATAVAFLASPAASYITGVSLDVDGGVNA